jgi:ABC-2 type transport system permease protein
VARLNKFINLVINEHIKIYSKKSIWVLFGVIFVIGILNAVIVNSVTKNDAQDQWQQNAEIQISSIKSDQSIDQLPDNLKDTINEQVAISQYRLDNNIPPQRSDSMWGFVQGSAAIIGLITMFVIVISASSVASEFSKGTIKLLLIRPHNRSKILLSKYLVSFIFALEMLLFLLVAYLIIGVIFFGADGSSLPYLSFQNGGIIESSMFTHILTVYSFACVELLVMVSFAFMLSCLTRNSALAIGLSIFLMFVGVTLVQFLVAFDYEWAKYIVFANMDLSVYFEGSPMIESMTLTFSIVVVAIYLLAFNVLSWLSFTKRDVLS